MKPMFVVYQDFHDSYGGGEWRRSFYETKEEAIELMQESLNENQSCLNDFVLEIDSIKNINDYVNIRFCRTNRRKYKKVVAYFDKDDRENRQFDYKLVIKEEVS